MNTDRNLERVVDLLKAVEVRELEQLRSLSLQKGTLVATMESLRVLKATETANIAVETSSSHWKFIDARQRWFDQNILDASANLAALAAKLEKQKLVAAKALGQHKSFTKLIGPTKADRTF